MHTHDSRGRILYPHPTAFAKLAPDTGKTKASMRDHAKTILARHLRRAMTPASTTSGHACGSDSCADAASAASILSARTSPISLVWKGN